MNILTLHESQKKTGNVFEKLGQKISHIKEDIADNIERRFHSSSPLTLSQVHQGSKTNAADDSFSIEKKKSAPTDLSSQQTTSDPSPVRQKTHSINQLAMNFGKRLHNKETSTLTDSSLLPSDSFRSFQDIFSTENSEHVKQVIMSGVRHQLHRTRTGSETLSEDSSINKSESLSTTPKPERSSTLLLAGPKFRSETIEPTSKFTRDTLYPICAAFILTSGLVTLLNPISSFISGFLVGFLFVSTFAFLISRLYVQLKTDETVVHEWIDFPQLSKKNPMKKNHEEKLPTFNSCGEIIFGRYDINDEEKFVRCPAVFQLHGSTLTIYLPDKAEVRENQQKQVQFIGFREFSIKNSKLMLVPEATLTRIKYWLNEYPIIIDNVQSLSERMNDEIKGKSNEFFQNSSTVLSLFFETGPDKEDWFHKLSLAINKSKEETEGIKLINSTQTDPVNFSLSTSTLNLITFSIPEAPLSNVVGQTVDCNENLVNLDERVATKPSEVLLTPHQKLNSSHRRETEVLRSQINETDILHDMAQARAIAQELRNESNEKDKDKDKETKESIGSHRTGSMKKKLRKQEENLDRILDAPDCLDQAAITLNFLIRRLLCDVFDEAFFQDLIKEKVESKLKEIAVTVLDDLHVETISLGNTFPVILKVEPMQWNDKGIWLNLFFFYRGNFKITIKTRLVLTRLLNYDPDFDQPIYGQHQSVHKDEENIDDNDLLQRQKLLAKEPEIPENAASRKLGTLLTKVAMNKHFQRIAGLKPVAGVIEKLSNAEIGAKVELTNFSGLMTINIPPPPSDRLWIGFPEMPDLNLKVTPVVGESKYSFTLIHDFLESRIRDELKRMLVLPSMDDQLLAFFRDWVIDVIAEIASKTEILSNDENKI